MIEATLCEIIDGEKLLLMLKGKRFDGFFYFDENMKELIKYRIETKD